MLDFNLKIRYLVYMMRNERKTMNWVQVTGGNKTQRKVAEITAHQMIKELLPRFRTLEIEVQLKNFQKLIEMRLVGVSWKMTIVPLQLKSIKILVSKNW